MTRKAYLNWFKMASLFLMATGCLGALASFAAGSGLWLFFLDLVLWPLDGQPDGFTSAGYLLNAILGGVTIGWGILMYLLAQGPLARGQHEIAQFLLVSSLTWYTIDSLGSILAGAYGNVVLNSVFLLIFLPPLLALRKPVAVAESQV